jgi:hypothetical protein
MAEELGYGIRIPEMPGHQCLLAGHVTVNFYDQSECQDGV